MPKLFNLTWRNTFAVVAGLALFVLIFGLFFVTPLLIQYDADPKNLRASYALYSVISGILFTAAHNLRAWSKENNFAADVFGVAIAANSLCWFICFIMALPS